MADRPTEVVPHVSRVVLEGIVIRARIKADRMADFLPWLRGLGADGYAGDTGPRTNPVARYWQSRLAYPASIWRFGWTQDEAVLHRWFLLVVIREGSSFGDDCVELPPPDYQVRLLDALWERPGAAEGLTSMDVLDVCRELGL
jgi:hypothetical protein